MSLIMDINYCLSVLKKLTIVIPIYRFIKYKITPLTSINIGNEKPYKKLENRSNGQSWQILSAGIKSNRHKILSNFKLYLDINLENNNYSLLIKNTFSLGASEEILIPIAYYNHSNQAIQLNIDLQGGYSSKLFSPPASNGERYPAILRLEQSALEDQNDIIQKIECEILVDENIQLKFFKETDSISHISVRHRLFLFSKKIISRFYKFYEF